MYSININSPECCCLALFQYTMLVCVWLTQCCSIIIYYHGAIFNVGLHNLSGYLMCVCVCLSVWYSSSAPTASSFGPSANKDYQGWPSERCTWVCFFSLHSHNEEAWCVRLPRHNGVRITVCEPRTVALKKKYISHLLLPAFLAPSRWMTPHTPTAACAGGVCAHVREDVCALHVCVCAGMGGRAHEGRDGRAAEIIHFVRRQDKCRESRFSHFLLPCLSLVLFLGPVFCIVVIRPTACESISTQ